MNLSYAQHIESVSDLKVEVHNKKNTMEKNAFAYTYLGYAGREAVTGGEGVIRKALIALALLATVAFVPRLVKHMRGK